MPEERREGTLERERRGGWELVYSVVRSERPEREANNREREGVGGGGVAGTSECSLYVCWECFMCTAI